MNNVRGLYPPLYGATPSGGGGGGGGGQHIQVDTLPEASLANKNKIVQYVGATTETITNAYFYKCVENTGYDWEETEASETYTEAETLPTASAETIGTIYKVGDKYYQTIIVLTYSWDPVEVMQTSGGYQLVASVVCDGVKSYRTLFSELMENVTLSNDKTYLLKIVGNSAIYHETSRPVNTNILGFYQTFSVGSTIYTDNILISKTSSEVQYTKDNNDVSSYVPTNGLIIKLFAIDVDSAIN